MPRPRSQAFLLISVLLGCYLEAQPTLQQVWATHDQFVLSGSGKPVVIDPSSSHSFNGKHGQMARGCLRVSSNTWPFSNGARDSHQCSQEHLLLWNRGRRAVGIQPLSRNPAGCRPTFPASVSAPMLGRSASCPSLPFVRPRAPSSLESQEKGSWHTVSVSQPGRLLNTLSLPACSLQHLAVLKRCPSLPSVRASVPRPSSWGSTLGL
jgi:hypothetical protein